jgi:hypothetical protein
MRRRLLRALFGAGVLVSVGAPRAGAASGPPTTDIARLSGSLATYVASLGTHAGVSVLDLTARTNYAYHPTGRFIKASTIKVALAMAAYDRSRRTGVPLTKAELAMMAVMIQRSDNASASYFYGRVGGAAGLSAYLRRIGLSGWTACPPNPSAWGYSSESAVTGAQVLEKLWKGQARISAAARTHILYLMTHIISSQRWAIGGAAPRAHRSPRRTAG